MHDDNNTSLDLSVIVPAYNTETFIEHCLVSLCEQDYDPSRFEVIVVDDASPDGLASVVRRLQKKYANLRYLRQLHGRQGKAKNYGLREAKGKYIAFMDSDDCWRYANTISILVDILRKNHLDLLQSDVALNVWHGELPQLDREKTFLLYQFTIGIPIFNAENFSFPTASLYTGENFFKAFLLFGKTQLSKIPIGRTPLYGPSVRRDVSAAYNGGIMLIACIPIQR
ncbi:MAG: glycosyltransferase [Akkermansiaceae bacterium]|nr:glycosyltransferase [Akkermansiaceae bacterium]